MSANINQTQGTIAGLTAKEAAARLDQFGPNEPAATQQHSLLSDFLHVFANPLVLILVIAAIISAFMGQATDARIIGVIVLLAHARGVHIELTTLVIPTVNDSDSALRGIAQRITRDLGPQVPWHVSGYFPAYRFTAPPTPSQTLERAWQIGKEAGLEFVYTGNVPGDPHENTYCPACGELLIRRMGFDVVEYKLRAGKCPDCGRSLAGIW